MVEWLLSVRKADLRTDDNPDSEQIEHTVAKPLMRNSVSVEQIQDSARKSLLSYGLHALMPSELTFHFQFSTFHFLPPPRNQRFRSSQREDKKKYQSFNCSTVQPISSLHIKFRMFPLYIR